MATKKADPPAALKVDLTETIPPAVKAQGTKADALQVALNAGTPAPPVQLAPGEPAPPTTPPAEPAKLAPTPVATPPEAPPPTTPTEQYWKGQHDALKTGSDKDILDLQGDVQRLNDAIWQQSQSITGLLKTNEALTGASPEGQVIPGQPGTPGAPGQPAGLPLAELVPEDFTGYGSEIVDLVHVVNALKAENTSLKGASQRIQNIETRTIQTAQDLMFKHLDDNVQDWEQINKTRPWLDWLNGVDPLSGYKRQALLDDAFAANNGSRVAGFFSTFFAETGQQPPPPGLVPAPPAGGELPAAAPILPDTTGPGAPPGAPPVPEITKEQFLMAQKEMQTGRMTYEDFQTVTNNYQRQEVARARAARAA